MPTLTEVVPEESLAPTTMVGSSRSQVDAQTEQKPKQLLGPLEKAAVPVPAIAADIQNDNPQPAAAAQPQQLENAFDAVVDGQHTEHQTPSEPVPEPPFDTSALSSIQAIASDGWSPDLLEEAIVHRVMQRIDIGLDQRLREAIATVVLEQTRSLLPRLREEVESVVRQVVCEAVAEEMATKAIVAVRRS